MRLSQHVWREGRTPSPQEYEKVYVKLKRISSLIRAHLPSPKGWQNYNSVPRVIQNTEHREGSERLWLLKLLVVRF